MPDQISPSNAVCTPAVMVMAAGTGGHIIPALEMARRLTDAGLGVHFLGTCEGMAPKLAGHLPYLGIDMQGIRGKGAMQAMRAPAMVTRCAKSVRDYIKKYKIQAVIGFGGYVTVPGMVGAQGAGAHLFLHEQNAIAGLANRLMARFCSGVYQAFDGAFNARFDPITVGNPVRDAIWQTSPVAQDAPMRLLVIGGSLGARALNKVTVDLIALAQRQGYTLLVQHQCGSALLDETRSCYLEAGVDMSKVHLVPFIEDMAKAYAQATAVLCRAGALSVSEVGAAARGAIFVPLPHATDDHQNKNAQTLSDQGAGILVPQSALNAQRVLEILQREDWHAMGVQARAQTRIFDDTMTQDILTKMGLLGA